MQRAKKATNKNFFNIILKKTEKIIIDKKNHKSIKMINLNIGIIRVVIIRITSQIINSNPMIADIKTLISTRLKITKAIRTKMSGKVILTIIINKNTLQTMTVMINNLIINNIYFLTQVIIMIGIIKMKDSNIVVI